MLAEPCSSSVSSRALGASDAHRHHDVAEALLRFGHRDQHAAGGGGEVEADGLVLEDAEHFKEIGDVEAHVELVVRPGHVEAFESLFVVGVRALDLQALAVEDPADAVELLVRHDADAAKRVGDRLALKFKGVRVRVLRGKHALVVGEAAFDELAHEGDVAEGEAHLKVRELDADGRVVLGEQANELAHGLARDDGLHRGVFVINVDFAAGETMGVGGDGAKLLALDDEEYAVEVVADVLTGHSEGRHREQVAQRAGRDEERRLPLAFLEDGVFVGGERLKLELAVVAADREAAVAEIELDLVGGGKSRQDAGELGGADREAGVDACDADGSLGADLDIEVSGGELDVLAVLLDQDVAQNRQRLALFNNAFDDFDGFEQVFADALDVLHNKYLVKNSKNRVPSGASVSP